MSYLQIEPKRNGRSSATKHEIIKVSCSKVDGAMSPVKTKDVEGCYYEAVGGSSKIQRSEFTKSLSKNGNFSPIRHISNSNHRLSFMSQSPTRYDEKYSNSQSKVETSPFDAPALMAYSEDLDAGFEHGSSSKNCRIKKQISSDNKTIKISKLIDFHREIEENIRTSDLVGGFGT
jgi:hypothetical protein